jgi:glucose-1-phosphate adenylyltransferase
LLNPQVWNELFYKPGLIYTKIKDEPPAKYLRHSDVSNSLIANGCIIDGTVENSILFRAVKVHKGVHLKNCIVLQNCEIRENVSIENAILDKDVVVKTGRELKGDIAVPYIASKKKII